jgi:hypothetical protein
MKRSLPLWVVLSCSLAPYPAAYGEPVAEESVEAGAMTRSLQPGVILTFKNVKSGRCLGVNHASTANGALLKQFTCDNAPNQRWRVERRGIEHTFVNVKSGKCIGVDGASVKPGANLGQYNCGDAAPNQSWVLVSDTSDLVRNLRNVKSGLCIGVDRASTANGAQLKQFACNLTAPNQEWRLVLL